MIVYFTYFISAAVILTKWFDCISTLKRIQGIQMESNPIARVLMYRLGIRGTVWFAFAVAVVVTVLSQLYVQLWTVYPSSSRCESSKCLSCSIPSKPISVYG